MSMILSLTLDWLATEKPTWEEFATVSELEEREVRRIRFAVVEGVSMSGYQGDHVTEDKCCGYRVATQSNRDGNVQSNQMGPLSKQLINELPSA